LKNQEAKAACMLPNVARYQLRYIPRGAIIIGGVPTVPYYYIKKIFICQEKSVVWTQKYLNLFDFFGKVLFIL